MSDETSTGDDEHSSTVTRVGRLAIALSVGLALGAVGLAIYAYAARVPSGQTATYLAPAGHLLLISLIGGGVAGAAVIWLGARAIVGLNAAGHASVLLAGTVAVAAYGFLNAKSAQHAMLISGPGARPVVLIAQISWVVLVCAALFLLAGATSASPDSARRPGRTAVAVSAASGVALAAVAGIMVTSASGVGTSSATTADRVATPALPTSVGTNVAYTVKVDARGVRPAGPGFVGITDGAVIGFDGTTGAQRWRFPRADLPERCGDVSLWSTGVRDDAVVAVQCTRPPNTHDPDRYSSDHDDDVAFLVGLDATTGERLWLNDADWHLRGRANGDGDILAAVSPGKVGALDPRTGKPLWVKERPDDDCSRSRYDAVGSTLIFVDACGDALHVYDAESESTIDFTKQPGFPSGDVSTELVAVDKGLAVIQAAGIRIMDGVLLIVDTQTKDVQIVPGPYARGPESEALIPGPVLEIDRDGSAQTVTLHVPAERRSVHVTGLEMFRDPAAQRWALVGDEFVTASAYQGDFDEKVAAVPVAGGQAALKPNPCGDRMSSVVPVPGAVLALCANESDNGSIIGYDVVGLR
ncbi:PQQ-binding-like beta-propeller repeat protein [Mycobacterium sp. DL99]|uniref:outer membrane protein assembly factor BamB family protein n=1 Tax=Mycobacterium sp. DL99 TaxID=2528957 RepID=UPI001080BEBC|nr:PQQ-binding-like beta-propeller repeat protein [Mycobacterium sp. DL99]